MHLTSKLLESKGACPEQVALFRKLFPRGRKVTAKLCAKHARSFNWDWAAQHLLSATALRAYKKARAPALRAHEEAIAPAWRAYEEAIAPAGRTYEEAHASAWRAHEEAIAPAWRAYEEAIASAFGKIAEGVE